MTIFYHIQIFFTSQLPVCKVMVSLRLLELVVAGSYILFVPRTLQKMYSSVGWNLIASVCLGVLA